MPAPSVPGTKGVGGFIWYCPDTSRQSMKLTDAAWMSTSTLPAAGSGSGIWPMRSALGPLKPSQMTASPVRQGEIAPALPAAAPRSRSSRANSSEPASTVPAAERKRSTASALRTNEVGSWFR